MGGGWEEAKADDGPGAGPDEGPGGRGKTAFQVVGLRGTVRLVFSVIIVNGRYSAPGEVGFQ